MKDNKFVITVKDNKVDFEHDSPVSLQDLLCILLPVIEGSIQLNVEALLNEPEFEGSEAEIRDELFDFMNTAYSSSLGRIDPNGELHPTLTEKAIREAEDKIINEGRLNEVKAGS